MIDDMQMTNEIITKDLVDKIFHLIQINTEFKRESIWYEIQDDRAFIYIRITVTEIDRKHSESTRYIADLLNQLVPGRTDDCSWMVSLIMKGETIETYFGGNLSSPKMGFPE